MKYLLLALLLMLSTGCTDSKKEAEIGKLRYELFNKCMEMAAKMPRQSDDDVSDIVGKCDTISYYQAQHLMMDK